MRSHGLTRPITYGDGDSLAYIAYVHILPCSAMSVWMHRIRLYLQYHLCQMVWYKHQKLVENATTQNNGSANSVDTVQKFFGVESWQVLQCRLVPLISVHLTAIRF